MTQPDQQRRKPKGGKASNRPDATTQSRSAQKAAFQKGQKTRKAAPGVAVRKLAHQLLCRVLDEKRPLDTLWADPRLATLADKDRGLVRALVATTLRQLGKLDHILDQLLDKPLAPKAKAVHRLLQLGGAQLFFLDVADHAAVSTSVDVAEADPKLRHFKKLINALLRRMVRERDALQATIQDMSLNTPAWLYRSWVEVYGADLALQIATANGQEAALDLTAKEHPAELAKRLGGIVLPTGSIRLSKHQGKVTELDGFDAGEWWVQDAAAALPARLLGDVAGKSVADLCAAPGGKTAQLAACGANVTAIDLSEERLERLGENLKRLNLQERVEIVPCDVLHFEPDQPFDAILLDAPCSATGTIRRHPDVPHLKTPQDIESLAEIQAQLLAKAASWLAPGGTLVYCTCSLQAEEGPDQIKHFLAAFPAFACDPILPSDLPGLGAALSAEGHLRTLPHFAIGDCGTGLDGFFAARLNRMSD